MDLSIIIVSWNVKDLLRKNLEALYSNTKNINFEVFVVDNKSTDGSAEMLIKDFPQVNTIANNYNAGFSAANNQAMEIAKGRYVLLLNPDMQVKKGTLENMISWMDKQSGVGVAGCRLLKENGEIIPHVRRYPKLCDQLAIIMKLPHLFPNILNKYLFKEFDYSKEAEVDSIRGSFFMIKRELIEKIGGLDDRYFIWFEEVDYCRQAKQAGFKVMYTPVVDCVDYVGKSFSQIPRGKAQNYFQDSMLKYFLKWESVWQHSVLSLAWPIGKLLVKIGNVFNVKRKEGVN